MADWSLTSELMALIVLCLLIAQVLASKAFSKTHRRALYLSSLFLACGSIVLNAASVELLANYSSSHFIPTTIVNTLYFIVSVWMASAIALYLFDLLLEHVYDRRCWNRAILGVGILNALFLVLMVVNGATGLIYSISPDGIYEKGPLNLIGYGVVGTETLMLLWCYYTNHASVSKQVTKVIRLLPPLVIALVVYQFAFPSILLNGTIGAIALLIITLNFQSRRIDTDGLTLLGDRKSFYDELHLESVGNQSFQIFTVSIHDFASVNRRLGHKSADELLYQIASWLNTLSRKVHAFRYGKVSFALVCPYRDEADTSHLLKTIAERFNSVWCIGNTKCLISVGCCSLVRHHEDWSPDLIIAFLDAMNERIKTQHLPVLQFSKLIEQELEREIYVTEALKNAIKQKTFHINYQPILDCKQNKFNVAEALIRLDDSNTTLSPAEFIPLAERLGVIDDISLLMLDKVCCFLGNTSESDLQAVSINIPMSQMFDDQLPARIQSSLDAYHVDPHRLKIEITERILAESAEIVERTIMELDSRGIGCYLDDFGTGYSNFSLVIKLPLEYVKIDCTLTADVSENQRSREALRKLIELFHGLGIKVLAEGIETDRQSEALRHDGVDALQGYLLTKPLDETELLRFFHITQQP